MEGFGGIGKRMTNKEMRRILEKMVDGSETFLYHIAEPLILVGVAKTKIRKMNKAELLKELEEAQQDSWFERLMEEIRKEDAGED